MKTALTIAGSDSSGGAGVQADLKTFTVLGVYGMSAITAITAQNTLGVKEALEVSTALVAKQIDVVATDIQIDATKTGMLGSTEMINVVEDAIKRNKLQPYVCDPVMVAKSGDKLLKAEAVAALQKKLIPLATVVTPNLRETAALVDVDRMDATIAAAKDAAIHAGQRRPAASNAPDPTTVRAMAASSAGPAGADSAESADRRPSGPARPR